jgi:trimethylamine--corrinoid protein Co-methyltransferase
VRNPAPSVSIHGYFLGYAHTLRHYRNSLFESAFSGGESMESWEESDSREMQGRTLLVNYENRLLGRAMREALEDRVTQRKSELPEESKLRGMWH